MKLSLRSIKTEETLQIEVPSSYPLQHLEDVVSQTSSSSSSSSSSSLHLSLNQKDELLGSSPQDSLQSVGDTSGDLIFFTLNPNVFSSETLVVQSHSNSLDPNSSQSLNSPETLTLGPDSQKKRTVCVEEDQTLVLNIQKEETLDSESEKIETEPENMIKRTLDVEEDQTLVLNTQKEETLDSESGEIETEPENMNVDEDGSIVKVAKSFSVPCFLRKVFKNEVGERRGGDHKLLVIAVHAVLLESGFIAFDPVLKRKIEGFYLPDERPSFAFTMSLSYTLPELIVQGSSAVETVVLKFQRLGNYVCIYGSLTKNGSGIYRLCLVEDRLVLDLNVMWGIDESIDKRIFLDIYPERKVFEFWKNVKDRLALPLLVDLCEKAGLASPPCFMRLPSDLKLKIFESLHGVDIAKVGCVCSELRYLSSNDDLWKQKVAEQFGHVEGSQEGSHWKEKFSNSWETRKRRKESGMFEWFQPVNFEHFRFYGPTYLYGQAVIDGDDDIEQPAFHPGWPF
ncbi:hypothetical protein ACSBR2_019103 [Camellia fascicularis]